MSEEKTLPGRPEALADENIEKVSGGEDGMSILGGTAPLHECVRAWRKKCLACGALYLSNEALRCAVCLSEAFAWVEANDWEETT